MKQWRCAYPTLTSTAALHFMVRAFSTILSPMTTVPMSEFSEVNLIDLGLSTTLQELVIQRFGDESNPSNDSNPMLIPFKHAEEKAKEAWERQQVETTNKVSATAMVTKTNVFICMSSLIFHQCRVLSCPKLMRAWTIC